MTRLDEIKIEKEELLKYREFLCQIENINALNSTPNTIQESEMEEKTTFEKPKVKKLGVRNNGNNTRY